MAKSKKIPALKPYSIEKGDGYIDWYKRINYLKSLIVQNPPYGLIQKRIDKCRIDSSSWVTCACGNLCAAIPRGAIGSPLDHTLQELGRAFYDIWCDAHLIRIPGKIPYNQAEHLFQEDYKMRYRYRKELGLLISPQYVYLYALLLDAEYTLNQIEQRSGEILHQMAIESGIIYPAKPDNC